MNISPFRKRPDALEKARSALAEASAKLVALTKRRDKLLIAVADDAEIATIDHEIENARRAEKTEQDRIRLLEQKAAEAERQAVARRKAQLIEQNAAALKESTALAAQVEAAISNLVKLVDELVGEREKVAAAWPFNSADTGTFLLNGGSIRPFIAFEFFRASARPFGGGISLPGAKCPNFDFTMQPEKIKPLSAVVFEASDAAVHKMRGNS